MISSNIFFSNETPVREFIDLTNMTAAKLAQIIANFTNLKAVILADYLESDVSSALYQQVDLV